MWVSQICERGGGATGSLSHRDDQAYRHRGGLN